MDIYASSSTRTTAGYKAVVEQPDGPDGKATIHLHCHDVHGTYLAIDEEAARHLVGILVDALEEVTAFLNSERAQEEAVF